MFIWMKLKKYLAHIMQIVYAEYVVKVTQNRTAHRRAAIESHNVVGFIALFFRLLLCGSGRTWKGWRHNDDYRAFRFQRIQHFGHA
jgi:hypothetical protein